MFDDTRPGIHLWWAIWSQEYPSSHHIFSMRWGAGEPATERRMEFPNHPVIDDSMSTGFFMTVDAKSCTWELVNIPWFNIIDRVSSSFLVNIPLFIDIYRLSSPSYSGGASNSEIPQLLDPSLLSVVQASSHLPHPPEQDAAERLADSPGWEPDGNGWSVFLPHFFHANICELQWKRGDLTINS